MSNKSFIGQDRTLYIGLTMLILAMSTDPALAAQGDWVKPGIDFVEDLKTGLVNVGIPLVGLGIIITGLIMAFTGRLEFARLSIMIAAGTLLMIGPSVATALLSNFG